MGKQLNQYFEQALDFEENGHVEEALHICEKCIHDFPEFKNEILLEIAKMNYRNGKQEQALERFLMLFKDTGDTAIRDLIVEAYYGEREQEYNRKYQENSRQLKSYPHFYGNMDNIGREELAYYPIYANDEQIVYYDCLAKEFGIIERSKLLINETIEKVCLGNNIMWMEDIIHLEKKTRMKNPLLDMDNALLLVYQRETWELLLQLLDLEELLKFDRILFYDDASYLESSFVEVGVERPQVMVGDYPEKIADILCLSRERIKQEYNKYREEAFAYYKENGEEIVQHIKDGKPKILFITSRFTTALQYHTRDCKAAAERMGLETELLIEKDRLGTGRTTLLDIKRIAEFKPDIIFVIDHFRHEFRAIDGMDTVVFVCWVQDPMPEIMDKNTPPKLTDRDFVMKHYTTWKKFEEVGYDEKKLIDAPVPADSQIYQPYELTEFEKEKYGCDICFVCHGSDIDGHIEKIVSRVPDECKEMVKVVYEGYQSYVYDTGELFYEEKVFAEYIQGVLRQVFNFSLNFNVLGVLANDMYLWFNQLVFRQVLVGWILDAGFTNIRLWGNGWKKSKKYEQYAMGSAQNGETLSKIYQASKIVIGNNVQTTAAARAWETMLSGGFYMSNYIPEESDAVDIRKILKADEEVVMFYNKEDLIKKIGYYLEHEEERQRMIEIGRKAALERMTFDKLMKRTLDEVAKRLDGRNS